MFKMRKNNKLHTINFENSIKQKEIVEKLTISLPYVKKLIQELKQREKRWYIRLQRKRYTETSAYKWEMGYLNAFLYIYAQLVFKEYVFNYNIWKSTNAVKSTFVLFWL